MLCTPAVILVLGNASRASRSRRLEDVRLGARTAGTSCRVNEEVIERGAVKRRVRPREVDSVD